MKPLLIVLLLTFSGSAANAEQPKRFAFVDYEGTAKLGACGSKNEIWRRAGWPARLVPMEMTDINGVEWIQLKIGAFMPLQIPQGSEGWISHDRSTGEYTIQLLIGPSISFAGEKDRYSPKSCIARTKALPFSMSCESDGAESNKVCANITVKKMTKGTFTPDL